MGTFPEHIWVLIKELLIDNNAIIRNIAIKYQPSSQYNWLKGEVKPLTVIPFTNENIQTHEILYNTTNTNTILQYNNKMCYEFAINSLDNIDKIELNLGGQTFGIMYPKIFKVFNYLFNIPEKKENGYFIIPFWFSKMGIPFCEYHNLFIHIRYNPGYNQSILQYKTRNINALSKNDSYVLHTIGTPLLYKQNGRLCFNHPTSNIIIKTKLKEIIIVINKNEKLYLKSNKTIGDYNIFPISRSLKDYELMVNFSMIDMAVINGDFEEDFEEEVIQVHIQGCRFIGGMGGLMYAN